VTERERQSFWRLFESVRRVVVFLLGVLIIVDGLIGETDNQVPMLVIGMVMVGVLPLENLVGPWLNKRRGNGTQSMGSAPVRPGTDQPPPGPAA
jgi:hypothetical protein